MNQLKLFDNVEEVKYDEYVIDGHMNYYFKHVNPDGDIHDYMEWKTELEVDNLS